MHIHIGLVHFVLGFLGVILVGIPWRLIALKFKDKAIGQAMSIAY